MRHRAFVLIFIFIVSSCTINEYYWEIPEEIQTIEDYQDLIKSFDYVASYNWMTPDETYYSKTGACASYSGLLAYIMEYRFNYDDVRIVACMNVFHMIVYADGVYCEGQTGKQVGREYTVKYSMSVEDYVIQAKQR